MRFDALLLLMEDWPQRQIAFQCAKRFLDADQLQIVVPQLDRIGLGEVGAWVQASIRADAGAASSAKPTSRPIDRDTEDFDMNTLWCLLALQ